MSVSRLSTSVGAVTQSDAGADIQRRRLAIGMSVAKLAKLAGVDRGRLAALEAGQKVRDTTLAAVTRALADLEHELGMDMPSQVQGVPVSIPTQAPSSEGIIEFDITGDFGVHIVVKGPVVDADLLRRQAAAIIREIRGESTDQD